MTLSIKLKRDRVNNRSTMSTEMIAVLRRSARLKPAVVSVSDKDKTARSEKEDSRADGCEVYFLYLGILRHI